MSDETNQTGSGPRREFASEAEWRATVIAEIHGGITAILKKYKASIDYDIQGDACVTGEISYQEYITVNGEDCYFYGTTDLPRWAD